MPDITAAADESAATRLLGIAEAALGTQKSGPGTGSLGPFSASYSAQASFSGGAVNLKPPNIIELAGCNLAYSVSVSFTLDISKLLPQICIPPNCILNFCTPQICLPYPPPITVPSVNIGDTVTFSADFHLNPHLVGPDWLIDVKINSIPQLRFGPGTAGALATIGGALVAAALAEGGVYGPALAVALGLLLAAIGVAGLEGFLGPILTPFVSGLTFTIYDQPQLYPAIPAAGPFDPVVDVTITALDAVVQATDKNELVITASIAG